MNIRALAAGLQGQEVPPPAMENATPETGGVTSATGRSYLQNLVSSMAAQNADPVTGEQAYTVPQTLEEALSVIEDQRKQIADLTSQLQNKDQEIET